MAENQIHAVTGAFGYSGKYIAQRLLDKGGQVITLTNSVQRENPFGDRVKGFSFNFDQPEKLIQSLERVSVLYNTYWVRFNHKLFTHAMAVRMGHASCRFPGQKICKRTKAAKRPPNFLLRSVPTPVGSALH